MPEAWPSFLSTNLFCFPPPELQGRFEQLPAPDRNTGRLNATELRAIAVAENISSVVEFRIRPLAASWRYHLYVIVDKEYVYWWDESMRIQNFRGVTLYQPAGITNMSHVIAMFESGAGVEVMADKGHMTVHVYAPYTFLVSCACAKWPGTQSNAHRRCRPP